MIKVTVSPRFKEEKAYILSVLLTDFLGLSFELVWDESESDYRLSIGEKTIIVKDHFFNHIQSETYLEEQNIPSQIDFGDLFTHQNVPIIYGVSKLTKADHATTLHADIFASSFYMLSRWEELVLTERDIHDRFPGKASLAAKFDFLEQPIVNQYLDILRALLKASGVAPSAFKRRSYQLHFSHDVDHPVLFHSPLNVVKHFAFYVVKKNAPGEAIRILRRYMGSSRDPYDTYDLLMDISEQHNTLSHFNFMSGPKGTYDEGYTYTPAVKRIVSNIKKRGHIIGFHPGYETHKDVTELKRQKEALETRLNQLIMEGRQHYLRFSVPYTWQNWEDVGMQHDSTLGYADMVGFRAGVCYSFHPFNVITRKKLKLLETPLIAMDGTLVNNMKLSVSEVREKLIKLKSEVKKYDGTYSVLWHNSSFFLGRYSPYFGQLSQIIP